MSTRILFLSVSFVLLVSASPTRANGPWFVSPDGNDGNSCASATAPCATIEGALVKANPSDVVQVASGTYTAASSYERVVMLDKDVILSGGWDETFSVQAGVSILDGQDERRGLVVNSGVNADLNRFRIQHGAGFVEGGGGIFNVGGTLTLTDCDIRNNSAARGTQGGGILTRNGTLVLKRCTVADNAANSGAGIYSDGFSTITLQNTRVSGNTASIGSGIYALASTLKLRDSAIYDNSASIWGGGIYFIDQPTTLIVINSTISGNSAGWDGGGIYHSGGSGSINLFNSTISRNHAGNNGGGLYTDDSVSMRNSILAENDAQNSPECRASIVSFGHNLIGNSSGCISEPNDTDRIDVDPQLGPLADNGGMTETHALLPDSPAIDAGNPAGCYDDQYNRLTTDQRGVARPQRQACDIGAYEVEEDAAFRAEPSYFPLAPGNQWTYLSNGSQPETASISFQNVRISGVDMRILKEAQSGARFYFSGDQYSLYLHKIQYPRIPVPGYGRRNVALTAMPPILLMHADAEPGHTFYTSGTLRVGLSGLGAVRVPYSATFLHAGLESISVPAGDFDNVLKLQGMIRIPQLGTDLGETYYLAKGIGPVKYVESFLDILNVAELQNSNVSIHDLAVTGITAPDMVKLSTTKPSVSAMVVVRVQNRSSHRETIANSAVLANMLHLDVTSLGTCTQPSATLAVDTLRNRFPVGINPKKSLKISFKVAFDCANDPLAGRDHADYAYTASLDHAALDGQDDVHADDDHCPRTVSPPYQVDAYPDATIKDKGCGTRQADGTFGAAVLTDVVER